MRSILILNAKGGSGKTTVATNLAGYYANQGKKVVLADFDPQGSSIDWLRQRRRNFQRLWVSKRIAHQFASLKLQIF